MIVNGREVALGCRKANRIAGKVSSMYVYPMSVGGCESSQAVPVYIHSAYIKIISVFRSSSINPDNRASLVARS